MESTEIISTKEKVRDLRAQGLSIRGIAGKLGVTKHTVEKAVGELRDEFLRTTPQTEWAETQTDQVEGGRTLECVGQTGENSAQTLPQTPEKWQQTSNGTAIDDGFSGENGPETHEKHINTPEIPCFPGVFGFMSNYKKFLWDMQQAIHRRRYVWEGTLRKDYLIPLLNLESRARDLCLTNGIVYEELSLSEVLLRCGAYLGKVATATPVTSFMGVNRFRFHPDPEIEGLCTKARRGGFS